MLGSRRAYFTICSLNYIAYALTLHNSLKLSDPQAAKEFWLILADEPDDDAVLKTLPFQVVLAKDLNIPTFWDMAMRYSIMEFNTAVKPAAFKHLINDRGYSEVVYLDPDILVVRALTDVHEALSGGADIVLTPHTVAPLEDGFDPDDQRIMQTGIFNLGFLACRNSIATLDLLNWWDRRMIAGCRVDLENGIFVDQKYMDLAPVFCEAAYILRHTGYNIAYWNLPNRKVSKSDNTWLADGKPAHFFHFSGVVADDPDVFSKHQNRFDPNDIGELKSLFLEYLARLKRNGHNTWRKMSYCYGKFSDGSDIPPIYRKIYQQFCKPSTLPYENVFQSDFLLLNAPDERIDQQYPLKISRVMFEIWTERPDLQKAFPLSNRQGREAFARWFIASAKTEYGLPEEAFSNLNTQISDGRSKRAINAPRSRASQLQRSFSRKALSFAPAIRPIYRALPMSWRTKARDSLLNSAAQPSYASILKSHNQHALNSTLKAGFDIYGYFSSFTGVGEGARRMVQIMEHASIPHQEFNIESEGHLALPEKDSHIPHKIALFHINADQTPRVLDNLGPSRLKGQYRIGYWAWELEVFPEAWNLAFDYVNEVWVPSEFVRAAVASRTSKPVHVVPHPIIPAPKPKGIGRLALPKGRFLILCAVDFRSFDARKNPRGMVDAFRLAFPEQKASDPILVVKMNGQHSRPAAREAFGKYIDHDKNIAVIDEDLNDNDWNTLKSTCDAFLSLHRSEGFGLSIAEMMALGKPVIATDFGGSRDFLSAETGFPVRFKKSRIKPGEYPESAGKYWADADLQHAASYLKAIVDETIDARRIKNGEAKILSEFSVLVIAQRVKALYNSIVNTHFE